MMEADLQLLRQNEQNAGVSREHIDEMLADIAAIGAAFELPDTRDSPSASRDHTSTPYAKRPPGAKARAKARAFVATA